MYEIFAKLLSDNNVTAYQVGKATGISTSTLSEWKNGKYTPKTDKLQKIADYFNVPVEYLLTGEKKSPDNMSEDDNINKIINALKNNPDVLSVSPTRKVPIVGSIACGTPILAEQNIDGYLDVEVRSNVDFALTCKGDSMAPKLLNEDIVLIHRQPVVDNGETAAVLIGEEATLKRVYIRDNSIILAPENLNYEPIHLTGEDMSNVSILGKVVGYVRYF